MIENTHLTKAAREDIQILCDELEARIAIEEQYDERECRESRKILNRGLKLLENTP